MQPDPRWRTVLTVAPYIVLGVLIVFTLSLEWGAPARLVPDLALCVAYGVWVFVLRNLPWPWKNRPAAIAVFLSVLIVLNLVLVLRAGWFGFLVVATYTFCFSLVGWPWQLLPVSATAIVAGLAQSSGSGDDTIGIVSTVAVVAINVVGMCGLGWALRLSQIRAQRAATEGERARLAREIHDTLAQGFAGIVTQLQAAEQAPDDSARKRHTDAALDLARDGLAEARRSVQALRPAALDVMRLPDALRSVADSWSRRTGIHVDVVTSGAGRTLPVESEVALLRTAQEALTNIERHADAHLVVLALTSQAGRTRLEVRDDGCGFDPAERATRPARPQEGGYGLVAMRERLESVAGALVVESQPGHGTAIRAEVPA